MPDLWSPRSRSFRQLRSRFDPVRMTTGAAHFDCFWARNAIFHGLSALGIRPGQKILIPAYICTAAIEPIEYFGAESRVLCN